MPPAKTRGSRGGGAKQQPTIANSLQKAALRRKDKAEAAAPRQPDEEDSEGDDADEEMVDASALHSADDAVDALPQRASRSRTAARRSKTAARAVEDVEEEEEEKSEETGPRRQNRLGAGTLAAQRKSGSDGSGGSDVLTGAYLLAAGNASDLSRRLKQTWTALQQTANQQHDDDVPLEKLRLVCTELLHDKLMEHTEKNVRSLAACCFVELLRVYAPDMPFKSNEELYDAFQLILEQLRCLAMEEHDDKGSNKTASSTDLHHLYVLESLASVKSFVLLIGMDYVPEESDEPLLVQLFRTLFNTIRKDHSIKIENLMLSILTTCIEESDGIDQNLLDVILSPLIHSNPHVEAIGVANLANVDSADRGPYHMAQELIRRTCDHLQSHLSHFFNSVLVDAPTTFMNKASELKEHVYTLIYEVHKVNSSLLLYVLPNVCMQLQVDEVATRSEAIALMGRLFASSHAEYGHDYMKNFRDFLGRFRDVSKEIRLQMVQVSAIIWQRKPELAVLIEKEFVARLTDPEWEVRRLVVNEVCDLAANHIELVGEECLRQVGERMKDKRVILRKEAMTGLSQVYAAHVSAYWAPEDGEDDEEDNDVSLSNVVPTSNVKKLGWVPDFVLKCFAYPQQELKLRVIQLLDDILLPKAFSEHCRAKGLVFIYHSLDATAREALRRLFVERAKCQTQLQLFLRAKKKSRTASTSPSQASVLLDSAKSALQVSIRPLFSDTDNLGKLLDQLATWRDQTVFKQLEVLCDCSKSQQDYRSARDRLVKAVGSKSPLGDFLKNFCRKLNLLTVSGGTIASYLRFFVGSGLPHHRENRSVTDLLLVVARTTPQLFAGFVQSEFETIMSESDDSDEARDPHDDDEEDEVERDDKVIISLLNALALFSEYWKKNQLENADSIDRHETDAVPSDALKDYLKQCCLGVALKGTTSQDDGTAAKFAAQILANFFGDSNDVGSLISKLCSKKVLAGPATATTVSTLLSLHVFTKRCPSHLSHRPENVSSLWDTLLENYIHQEKPESKNEAVKPKKASKTGYTIAKAAEVRCLAIKIAADLLLHCHGVDSSNLADRGRELVKLLFDLLRSDGKMWASTGSLPLKYRVSAACNILKLLRHRTIESSLALSEWHILGFVMQDSVDEVRRAFVKKLSSNLMKSSIPHPHKYLSFLVLAATENNAVIKKSARGLLSAAIERMRRMFKATSSRLSHTTTDDGDEEERQNASALMVPEYALPYVIHLLAHHPDFPIASASKFASSGQRGSLVTDPLWSEQVAYLDFFIDGLMPTNTAEADNIAFLLQILTKLSDCHDSSDPNGVSIYPLIECAVALLKRRIKNQSNLKAFPGKIYLPKQLYTAGKASDRRSSLKPSDHVNDQTEQEESSDAAVHQAKKSRISASLSPIKPSGALSTFLNMNSPPLSAQKRRSSPANSSKPRRTSVPTNPVPSSTHNSGDEAVETPSRRQSLMRKARSQAKTFVADSSSESDDDLDRFVPRASVSSRANKRESSTPSKSLVQKTLHGLTVSGSKTLTRSTPTKRARSPASSLDEETKGGSDMDVDGGDEQEMPSFRASRRRRGL